MECTDQNGKFTSEAHMHIQDVIIAWCKLLVALEMSIDGQQKNKEEDQNQRMTKGTVMVSTKG